MDLGQSVESDPWGRPYRMVMKKLRPKAAPLTADMDLALLEEAPEFFEMPPYIIYVIWAYLCDRWFGYTGKDGERRRSVERGVPQGSVLGPIL